MNDQNEKFTLEIQTTDKKCPIGETTGKENLKNNKIPVLSCEGACIRGEIANLLLHVPLLYVHLLVQNQHQIYPYIFYSEITHQTELNSLYQLNFQEFFRDSEGNNRQLIQLS